MTTDGPPRAARLLSAALAAALVLSACSSASSSKAARAPSGASTTAAGAGSALPRTTVHQTPGATYPATGPALPSDPALRRYVLAARVVCAAGRTRLSAIAAGADVVPHPTTDAQRLASKAWADAVAAQLDITASRLADLAVPSGHPELASVASRYRAAAERARTAGSAILADKGFLADAAFYRLGLSPCFSAR